MEQSHRLDANRPELSAYRLASWRRAPGAWDLAEPILTLWWQEQEPRNRTQRVQQATGGAGVRNHRGTSRTGAARQIGRGHA